MPSQIVGTTISLHNKAMYSLSVVDLEEIAIAATTSCYVCTGDALKPRRVLAEMRWRWCVAWIERKLSPGVPPGDLPPVPDPAPPLIENLGDAPLPPITDPDVIEPGEPNPAHTPMRVRGAKRSPESFAASLSTFKAGTVTRAEQLILKYRVRTFMVEANLADPSTQMASPQVHP